MSVGASLSVDERIAGPLAAIAMEYVCGSQGAVGNRIGRPQGTVGKLVHGQVGTVVLNSLKKGLGLAEYDSPGLIERFSVWGDPPPKSKGTPVNFGARNAALEHAKNEGRMPRVLWFVEHDPLFNEEHLVHKSIAWWLEVIEEFDLIARRVRPKTDEEYWGYQTWLSGATTRKMGRPTKDRVAPAKPRNRKSA